MEEPPLIEVAPGHQAACWLAEAGPRDLPILDAVPVPPANRPAVAGDPADAAAATVTPG